MVNPTRAYGKAARLIKLLPIPFVLGIILFLFWQPLGSICMIIYWILMLMLSLKTRTLAMQWKDEFLLSAGIWFFLGAITGILSTSWTLIVPVNVPLTEMSNSLDSASSAEQALRQVSPYIIDVMSQLVISVPMQFAIQATFSLLGWIKFRAHCRSIKDVQRYIVDDGLKKLLVGYKLQIGAAILAAGTIASVWGCFASILAPDSAGITGALILLVITIILGLGMVITAGGSFFALISGYDKTGSALAFIEKPSFEKDVGKGGNDQEIQEKRCNSCGNRFIYQERIKFCPICGAAL